jgi:hypothetical protein
LAVGVFAADYTSFIGDDVDFICNNTNAKWSLPNGTVLSNSSAKFVLDRTVNGSTLRINNFQTSDVGIYKCKGANSKVNHFDLKAFCEF